MQIGNVPTPDCLSTFGLLGAELSCSMLQFALLPPVTALFQPAGVPPGLASSKSIVSASAPGAVRAIAMKIKGIVFIIGCAWFHPTRISPLLPDHQLFLVPNNAGT